MSDSTHFSSPALRRFRARPADSSAPVVQGLVVGATRLGVCCPPAPLPVPVPASGASGACDTSPSPAPTMLTGLSSLSALLGAPVPFDDPVDFDGHRVPPPVSNTGGKSIKGGNEGKRIGLGLAWDSPFVTIDTFSFSFDGAAFGFDVGRMRKWMDWFSGGVFTVGGLLQKRYNGYCQCYAICLSSGDESQNLGFLGFSLLADNMRGRCFINLTGAACELLQPSHWASLYSVFEEFGLKITRCDIAFDDYDGLHPVSEARALYESGGFNAGGRRPSARYIDSYGDGDTFYVGKRQNGKMLRVYEKGKQLGDNESKWVRWELQLGCKDRTIPCDVLLTPLAYLKGAYPVALAWLDQAVVRVVKTIKRKGGIIFDKAVLFARRQAGRVIRYCRDVLGLDDESIVDELIAKEGRYPLLLTGVVAGNLCHVAY